MTVSQERAMPENVGLGISKAFSINEPNLTAIGSVPGIELDF